MDPNYVPIPYPKWIDPNGDGIGFCVDSPEEEARYIKSPMPEDSAVAAVSVEPGLAQPVRRGPGRPPKHAKENPCVS